ncbi:hypothetical protein NE237_015260 [Protea cynaroides]|uniref:Uncharacterized protein n=1 Tax=Protea cynaroides TaxID=273540 RepID=A0A9Q0GP66_9MAGN|nr:hypothetical protein NE237_027862 [Protea cynaroides]KAJ4968559.1 hypothetical protein NE237_015260 [Protea cynaroides]
MPVSPVDNETIKGRPIFLQQIIIHDRRLPFYPGSLFWRQLLELTLYLTCTDLGVSAWLLQVESAQAEDKDTETSFADSVSLLLCASRAPRSSRLTCFCKFLNYSLGEKTSWSRSPLPAPF